MIQTGIDLPAEYKAIFKAAAQVSALTMQARYDARNPAALSRLKAFGTELRAFPDSVMAAAKVQSEALMQEHAKQDAHYRKILGAWESFRAESFQWFGTAEQAYAAFAFRVRDGASSRDTP
jgi:TRAP-type mannitol/chloroaromatic compound transport system substrate-binding protein